ncbi:MAG TPA: hypothetical protein VFO10_30260 [Oligoflexus sp.]|uniref:hypothetical protein n=1 Tax=Oligoflexus sp. TaxID=1971216 RepID=UPI002D7FE424|nr:hypothetical protein [Oligoflexus sp.]HET9241589.1 hypothetical protein [Oligoflexus sp.]
MKRWVKIVAFLMLGLGSLELVWVIAANRYLQSQDFQELLQKGDLKISFEKASSSWPGQVHVKSLTLENASTRLDMPEADLHLSLMGLAGRRIIFWSAAGEGGSFAFEPSAPTAEGASGTQNHRASPPPAGEDSQESDWSVHFQKLRFRNLQQLKVGSFTAKGAMDISAELHIADEDRVRVRDGRVQLTAVETQWKDRNLAILQTLKGRFELDPFTENDELLRKLSLDVQGEAELEQGRVLQNVIVDAPWLHIKGLNLKSSGRIVLKQGQLMEPTRLTFQSDRMELELWKETVAGHGTLTLNVDKNLALDFAIPKFTVDHEGKGMVDVSGRDLSLKLATEDRDLLSRDRVWQAALVLPESTIHDLKYFNHFMPQGLGFQFRSGQGTFALHLDSASTQGNFIRVDAPAAAIAYEKQEFFGRVHQDLSIGDIDFVQEGFTVPKGELTLNVRPGGKDSREPEWAGQLSLSQGRIEVTPSRFEGIIKLKAADLRPLLWIFDPQSKLPDWSRKLFHKDQLAAQFQLKADENSYTIDQFKAETDELKLEAWYQGSQDKKRGKLFMRYGAISAGIAVHDDDFKVKLLSSREWFQKRQ